MALFKDTDSALLRDYIPVKGDFDIKLPLTVMDDVEQEFTIPAVGQEMYDELNDQYAADTLTVPNEALLKKVQAAQACQSMLYVKDMLSLDIKNTGIHIFSSENQKQAFEWQITRFEKELARLSFNRVEMYLRFLEENKAQYPTWSGSSAYTITRELLINSAREFTKFFSKMRDSRQIFQIFRAQIEQAEQQYIAPILGATLYAELKDQVLNNALTAPNQTLMPYVQRPLAYFSAWLGIQEHTVEVNPTGLFLPFRSDRSNINAATAPTEEALAQFLGHLEGRANHFLGVLTAFLDANYATYPDYPYDEDFTPRFDNKDKKTYRL